MPVDMSGYVPVDERIAEFRARFPQGTLQPVDPSKPYDVLTIGDKTFIVYTAAAYRTPDDQRPGIGVAYEPFPGKTNYTRDSELQNAETSAWGRAIVAVGAADTKRGIASAEEVRNRQADRDAPAPRQTAPAPDAAKATATKAVQDAGKRLRMDAGKLVADYERRNGGEAIQAATVGQLTAYAAVLNDLADIAAAQDVA